jgi:putative hydrolase of the HAD superfamily
MTAMIAAGGAATRADPSVSSATRRRVASAAMPPVRAVLFDFGHTLVDFRRTEEALREAYEQIRARIVAVAYMEVHELLDLIERVAGGVDRLVEASYAERRMEELDIAELFRQSLEEIGFRLPDDTLEHIILLDHSAYSNSMAADDETLDVLRDLRERGLRLGIVSNVTLRADLMRQDLDRLGIGPLMDGTAFSSDVGVRKPDPRIFQATLERVAADPTEAVFVGDRLVDDITGARALGMRTVLTHQFRQEDDPGIVPDARIDRLADLPGIIAAWGGNGPA